ncbi:hypothetical protein PARMER_01776 [Parabacteroides merdae ATCC 43184]|nr:hypothetical protein PARMER_01776 [Parabacteroides merdae ATCC 43184]
MPLSAVSSLLYKGYICRDNVRNSYNFASEKIRKVITKS